MGAADREQPASCGLVPVTSVCAELPQRSRTNGGAARLSLQSGVGLPCGGRAGRLQVGSTRGRCFVQLPLVGPAEEPTEPGAPQGREGSVSIRLGGGPPAGVGAAGGLQEKGLPGRVGGEKASIREVGGQDGYDPQGGPHGAEERRREKADWVRIGVAWAGPCALSRVFYQQRETPGSSCRRSAELHFDGRG